MAIGDDMSDWAPGQPPPWLAAYGPVPPPIDDSIAGAPGAAPSEQAPPFQLPPQQPGLGIPASMIDAAATAPGAPAGVPSIPPPIDPSIAGAPGAPSSPRSPPPGAGPATGEPPWLQGPPDAISGVNGRAPAPALADTAMQHVEGQDRAAGVALDPNAPIADRQAAWQRLSPEQRTNLVNSADPKQLAAIATSAMAPEELAAIGIRHQQAQIHEDSAARLELARKADEDAQRAHAAQQMAAQQTTAALAQVDADSKALSMEKVDPAEHGVGHFIASVLTSAIGGAMSQYSGGRNLALEELDKQTQRRIDAQKSNIANKWQGLNFKRNLITEQYTRGVDEARADATYRISQYDRALGELATKAQDYDPAGTTAMRIATTGQQIQAQRAQALQTFAQQDFNNRVKAAEVNQKAADAALKQQNEEANRKAQQHQHDQTIGLGYANADEARREHDMTDARAKQAHEDAVAAREDTKATAADQKLVENGMYDKSTGKFIYQPEGQQLLDQADQVAQADPAAAQKLRDEAKKHVWQVDKAKNKELSDKLASTQNLVDNLATLKDLVDTGKYIDPKNNARIATMYAQVKASAGEALHARFNEKEQETLDGVFGGDPQKIRNVDDRMLKTYAARFDQIAETAAQNATTDARGAGWRGTSTDQIIRMPKKVVDPIGDRERTMLTGKTAEELQADAQPNLDRDAKTAAVQYATGAAGAASHYASEVPEAFGAVGGLIRPSDPEGDFWTGAPKALRETTDTSDAVAPLSSSAESAIRDQAKAAAKPADRKRIIESFTSVLSQPDRPGLALHVFAVLRDEDPRLAAEVAAGLAPDARRAIGVYEKRTAPLGEVR